MLWHGRDGLFWLNLYVVRNFFRLSSNFVLWFDSTLETQTFIDYMPINVKLACMPISFIEAFAALVSSSNQKSLLETLYFLTTSIRYCDSRNNIFFFSLMRFHVFLEFAAPLLSNSVFHKLFVFPSRIWNILYYIEFTRWILEKIWYEISSFVKSRA